jgi:hypothetical protein
MGVGADRADFSRCVNSGRHNSPKENVTAKPDTQKATPLYRPDDWSSSESDADLRAGLPTISVFAAGAANAQAGNVWPEAAVLTLRRRLSGLL